MNKNSEPNSGVFPFIQDTFIPGKKDKEYILKISSNDTLTKYPFDFQVKFAMDIGINDNNYKKEAVIYSKYTNITSIEISDVVIPRFIPSSIIGRKIEGFRLVKTSSNKFMISCYPGCSIKNGSTILGVSVFNFIKLITPKETVFIFKRDIIHNYSILTNNPILNNQLVIDHVNYNNNIIPILDIIDNEITVDNYIDLPNTFPLIIVDSNILFKTSIATATETTLTIPYLPIELIENIYTDNTIRIIDSLQINYYFKIDSYFENNSDVILKGIWLNNVNNFNGLSDFYLYGYGSRDLLDERMFYIELDPFTPVKSTATNSQNDKMFGVLFPSTQSKEWVYLSGEPKELFLPTDFRKMDKMSIRLYDSNGNNLNDVFNKRLGLLNPEYNKNLYTTLIVKIEENSKSFHTKA
jgi:hypothetical protein